MPICFQALSCCPWAYAPCTGPGTQCLPNLPPPFLQLGEPRSALVVKPEAAGPGSGRRISELSTPLAEATMRLSCRLGPWENFSRCQGGDVASRWEEWAGAGSGRAGGCTFPEALSRLGPELSAELVGPSSLAWLVSWVGVCGVGVLPWRYFLGDRCRRQACSGSGLTSSLNRIKMGGKSHSPQQSTPGILPDWC